MTAPGSRRPLARDCQWCEQPIYLASCRDGRPRAFDVAVVPAAPIEVWAWRRGVGMEETDRVPGHHLHRCEAGALAHLRIGGGR